ncbi:hypothetical protein [Bradyrhizobium cenepequi]|uniref:hypothetical protein n=1 Tax=Bradyrhizobium cenepequi TaxID=2821403 RepID=UPI00289E940F|nr:hypothetical protein [Bradyrhizobium cenepequi]MCA6111798.1 hypothetical protein [Bradyrhizobium cenepequi]
MANGERHRGRRDSYEQRTNDSGTTVECHYADGDGREEWKGIYRELKHEPAEQAYPECIEDDSKGEHGGGSVRGCDGSRLPPPPRRN